MKRSTLLRSWKGLLVQGAAMIVLSLFIFGSPEAVLGVMAFWLGVGVIIGALAGIIAYFYAPKEDRDLFTLTGSIATLIVGILMISKILFTIKAITIVFGLLAAFFGLVLIVGSWKGRKTWSLWWLVALTGICSVVTGLKSCMDIYSGAQSISNLVGIAVLVSGIGLVCLAFLKREVGNIIKSKL
jgi:uncharacterized membrane protein HdeD (DUF308 family)